YDACGLKSYESYPYDSTYNTNSDQGTKYDYDAIERVIKKTNTGDSPQTFVTYDYSGVNVKITDESGSHITQQNWVAFGDPGDARLSSVVDAAGIGTSYSYNALGSLSQVVQPGATRTW